MGDKARRKGVTQTWGKGDDKKQWCGKLKRVRGETNITKLPLTLTIWFMGRSLQFKDRRSDFLYHLVLVQLTNQETVPQESSITCPILPISKLWKQDSNPDFKTSVISNISCWLRTITTLKKKNGRNLRRPCNPPLNLWIVLRNSNIPISEILMFLFQVMRA